MHIKQKTNIKKYIYFDNASTSIKSDFFIQEHIKIFENQNIFNQEFLVKKSEIICSIIEKISKYFEVSPNSISLIPSATYAINEIVNYLSLNQQSVKFNNKNQFTKIYLGKHEHISNVVPWLKASKINNWKILFFDYSNISKLDIKNNSIISIATLTNLEGKKLFFNNWKFLLNQINKLENITLITDITQEIQHSINFKSDMNNNLYKLLDFFFFSAHKFFGPFGVGVIYSKNPEISFGINLKNINSLHNYSLDWKSLYAWYKSFDFCLNDLKKNNITLKEKKLVCYFKKNFPKNKYISWINENASVPIFLLKTKYISAHEFLFFLEQNNIIARAGAACSYSQNYQKIQNKLIRLSCSYKNTIAELKFFFELLKKIKYEDFFKIQDADI